MPVPEHLSGDRPSADRGLFVPTAEVLSAFVTAPVLDYGDLRRDLDSAIDDELSADPFDRTGG